MLKILIVDDHALVRRGLHYVVKEGFPDAEITEAESAAAALEHIHNGKEIDLALVDVRMPDLDGLELLGEPTQGCIRAAAANKRIQLVSSCSHVLHDLYQLLKPADGPYVSFF